MSTATSSYVAKKASALGNPITNDSIFVQSDNSARSSFVSLYQLVEGTGTIQPPVVSFYVRATGRYTTGASSTLLVTLYYSTGAQSSITYNGTGVTAMTPTFTTTALSGSQNWDLECNLFWDYTSKVLNGYYWACFPASTTTCQITAQTTITAVTGVDLTTLSTATPVGGPGLILGAHFGTSNASNTVTLSEFIAEVL